MLINLFIASAIVLTTFVVILNFNRLLEWAEWTLHQLNKIKSFAEIVFKAYQNRHQLSS